MLPAPTSPAADVIPVGTLLGGLSVCPSTDQSGSPEPQQGEPACTIGAMGARPLSGLSLTKTTSWTTFDTAGQTIPYNYLVTNTGTTTLFSVAVSDNKVASVSCPDSSLAPNHSETCTGTYTVTQADVNTGSVTNAATASATDSDGNTATSSSTLTLRAANCNPPAIKSANSATADAGTTFSFTVTSCTTSVPIIKAVGLPPGLRLVNNHDGTATISGKPGIHDGGIYTATVTATVRYQPIATQSLVITVNNAPVFKSKAKDTVTTGTDFTYPITTDYGYPIPTITTSSELPGGVSLVAGSNPGTAALTGTPGPSAGGTYPITITANNGVGSPVNQSFTLAVYQPPAITSATTDTVAAGVVMTPFTVTDTGYPVPTLHATGLPNGLHLTDNHNLTGTISGTTKATAGTYPVTLTATSKSGTTTQSFSLIVTP